MRAPDQPGKVLAVLRPPDDPDLPDVWGLPAGRLAEGERPEEAARRLGREKLGVELDQVRVLRSGVADRTSYRLEMDLAGARLASGRPEVPQPGTGTTQYVRWRWADPAVLRPAAEQGSLCCRLFLEEAESDPSTSERGPSNAESHT